MPQAPPSAHRVYFSDLTAFAAGSDLLIDGDEANHAARVKRLRPGEPVTVLDGRGTWAEAELVRAEAGKRALLELRIRAVRRVEPVRPAVEIWCPPPKGDRLETMIDQLSQIGVAAWRPLRTARAERENFRPEKLERIAIESAKQCARAWTIRIDHWAELSDALADPRAIVADASGSPAAPVVADTILLLGPEGGWTPDEREQARAAGRSIVRFGPHTMRIETAGVAGAAVLLSHTQAGESR